MMIDRTNPSPLALAIGGMLAMAAAMGIGRFVYTPILPMMVQEAGISTAQAGMIASSNFFGYMLGAMLAATSLLSGSRRAWLVGSLLASTATTTMMAWTDSYAQFLILRFIGGLVSSWVLVFASALVIDRLVAAGKGGYTAILFAGVGVGIILASLLTSFAASSGENWRTAWLYSGGLGLMLVLVVAWLVPDNESIDQASATNMSNTHSQPMAGLLGAYGLFGFGYVITATFIVQLVRSSNYSLAVETWVWVLVGLCAAPSIWMWNKIAARIGNSKAFTVACIILALGVSASVLVTNIAGIIFSAVILGGTFMGITALGLVEARSRSAREPRHTMALMTTAFGIGQIVGPAVAGYMSHTSGSFFVPSLLASAALVLAAILVQSRTPRSNQ